MSNRRHPLQVELLEERNLLNATAIPEAHSAVVPNDPSFGSEYGLNNTGANGKVADADIDAPEAWNVSTGSTKSIVGVVDTGIDYRHQDLYKNIWLNQGEIPSTIKSKLIDIDGDGRITFWDLNDARNQGSGKITDLNVNGRIDGGDVLKPVAQGGWANAKSDDGDKFVDDLIGWDFLNNDNDPFDDNGHGTHVAGTIGAIGNNGVGVTGVNWRVQMIALKFMGANGRGGVNGAIDAINYAVAKGAFVSNHSWSMGSYVYQPLYDAIARAQNAGHIIVAAAGNGGSDLKSDNNDATGEYPGSFNLGNIIAVAATGSSDGLATFSNYGVKTVDLGAPGLGIYSTYPNDRYLSMGGTSMATPHVTGAVALVHALHPNWSATQVIQKILSTTDPIAALKGKTVTGGRLNLAKALDGGEKDLEGPRMMEMTPNAGSSGPVSSVRITFTEFIDPATFTTADVTIIAPSGTVIPVRSITSVSASTTSQFDVTFASQSAVGYYKIVVSPNIRDTSGNKLDQDRDGVSGELTQDRAIGGFSIAKQYNFNLLSPGNITDNGATRFTVNVDRSITIASVRVALVLTHSQLANLRIHLRGPDGTDVLLTDRGARGTNFTWATFDDTATQTLADGNSPYTGSYRPDGDLSDFADKDARGTWELWIDDTIAGQIGRLYQFRLIVNEGPVSARTLTVRDRTTPLVTDTARGDGGSTASMVLDTDHAPEPIPSSLSTTPVVKSTATRWQEARAQARQETAWWLWASSEANEAVSIEQLMQFFAQENDR